MTRRARPGAPERPPVTQSYDLLVFDLDGTLAETRYALTASVNHALEGLGRPRVSLPEIVEFVGHGARRLLERALGPGATEDEIETGVARFLDHHAERCLEESVLYPGVRETLLELTGHALAVLTNKPAAPAERLLEGLGIRDAFGEVIAGDDVRFGKKPDPGGLLALMEALGARAERTLLVGDTAVDIRTARAAGAQAAGVSWGFRPGEFLDDPPDYLVESFPQILDLSPRGKMSRPGSGRGKPWASSRGFD